MRKHGVRGAYKNKSRDKFTQHFGQPIENYPSFQRATETLKPKTVKSYLGVLPNYFIYLQQDPDAVIKQRQQDIINVDATQTEYYERKTTTYLKMLEKQGYAGLGIRGWKGIIQGFYSNNSKRLSLDLHKLHISKARKHKKYSPSNSEVKQLLQKADCARDKLIIILMYQNGPSPVDVAALYTNDLPKSAWSYYEKSRSKTGEVWRGVTTPDITEALTVYLNIRVKVKEDTPLFVGREGPLNSDAISETVSTIIHRSDLAEIEGLKPTSLRDAFEDALVSANINPKIKEALMGHTGDIEHQYGGYEQHKKNCVAAMKQVYPYIQLSNKQNEDTDSKQDIETLKKDFAEMKTTVDLFLKNDENLKRIKQIQRHDKQITVKINNDVMQQEIDKLEKEVSKAKYKLKDKH
jgi:integrase